MDFELSNELKLAIGGIVFAAVAFGALSIYQQLRLKRENREKLQTLRQAAVGAADVPAGATRFFIARFRGRTQRFFRVYVDDGALLFVHAGPYFAMVDAEIARGTDKRHWLLQAGNVLIVGLAGGAVIALAALALIGRAAMRKAADNPDGATDIMTIVLGSIALFAVAFIIIVPGIVWRIVQRGTELDALPLSGLREQALADPLGFCATPENVSGIKVKQLDPDTKYGASTELAATLTFRHQPTGKWNIETTKTHDTHQAIHEFQQLFGHAAIAMDSAFEKRLGATLQFAAHVRA